MATGSPEEFSIDDIQALQDDQIILESPAPGKRTVTAALLSPLSTFTSSSSISSGGSVVSVRYVDFKPSNLNSFHLPTTSISSAALEFIGFTPDAANEIFHNWATRPDPGNNPDTLLSHALGRVGGIDYQAGLQGLSERESIAAMGISEATQDAIMDPHFSHIRETEFLRFWVKHTLRVNYAALERLQNQLQKAAIRSRASQKAKRASLPHAKDIFAQSSGASSSVPEVTATFNSLAETDNLPTNWIAVAHSSQPLENHITLYMAKARDEMEDMIHEDGSLDLNGIATSSGGDFNAMGPALYFTAEKQTADMYAAFAARRCSYSPIWMIEVQIPQTYLTSLNRKQLWYSSDWKEYVWWCKKKKEPPTEFDECWKHGGADIIKGHICKKLSPLVARIKAEEVQEKIDESFILTVEGTSSRSTQTAFMQVEKFKEFSNVVRGKIHIDIRPPSLTIAKE